MAHSSLAWSSEAPWAFGALVTHFLIMLKRKYPKIQLELRDKLFQHQESESEAKYVSKLVLDS